MPRKDNDDKQSDLVCDTIMTFIHMKFFKILLSSYTGLSEAVFGEDISAQYLGRSQRGGGA